MRCDNKIIFITGASSGIGAATAETFAALGAKLIMCARRESKLIELAAHLTEKYQTESLLLQIDVSQQEIVFDAINNLPTEWHEIDVLVNNAGLAAGLSKFQDSDLSDWEQMIDTNVKGLLYVTKAILPSMLQRDRGHIINIGSIAGHETYPKGAVYCATKAAVLAISQGIKMDILGSQVRVTTIDPGMVETEFSLVRFKGDAEKAEKIYQGMTPLTPHDIADAIVYCATRPAHVNVSDMIILATDQAAATMTSRKGTATPN